MRNFVVLSGCSGGGKSTLLAELARRGHAIVAEPGLRIVREEQAGDGKALPWVDLKAFAQRAVAMALADRAAMAAEAGWVFFDRGLIDAAAALERATGEPALAALGGAHPYHPCVFLTPPWPEIYATGAERRHDFAAAVAEYDDLRRAYAGLGYGIDILERVSVGQRADHVLATLAAIS
jgi:predicted ATPase